MAGIREREISWPSGQFGQVEPTGVADSLSQSNPSFPNSETNNSGYHTIGRSYLAAKKKAEIRSSNPGLSVISVHTEAEERRTPVFGAPSTPFLGASFPSYEKPLLRRTPIVDTASRQPYTLSDVSTSSIPTNPTTSYTQRALYEHNNFADTPKRKSSDRVPLYPYVPQRYTSRESQTPKKHKKKVKTAISDALVNTAAWVVRPISQPLLDKKLHNGLADLSPEDKDVVATFLYPQTKKEKQLPPPTLSWAPSLVNPSYHSIIEPRTKKEQALHTVADLLSETAILLRSPYSHEKFVGYSDDGEITADDIQVTEDGDILFSTRFSKGYDLQVFMANPLDKTYPHTMKMAFGLKSPNQGDAYFSLHTSRFEKKLLQHIAWEIARVASNSLKEPISKTMRHQLNHVFLAAIENVFGEEVPASQPSPAYFFSGADWPFITTSQYMKDESNPQTFSAYFHLAEPHDPPIHLDILGAFSEGDLRIDSFLTSPSSPTEQNLFYILSPRNEVRIVGGDEYNTSDTKSLLTAIQKRTLAFLSALVSREQLPIEPTDRHTTLGRIDEVVLRLQEFLLQQGMAKLSTTMPEDIPAKMAYPAYSRRHYSYLPIA